MTRLNEMTGVTGMIRITLENGLTVMTRMTRMTRMAGMTGMTRMTRMTGMTREKIRGLG